MKLDSNQGTHEMSIETLRRAFKHGTYARLNGQPREPTYNDPAHRAQWLIGWDCTDSNQTNYHTRKMAALDRIRREGRDAYRAGKVLSGCPYGNADMTKVEAWAQGFKAERDKRPTFWVDEMAHHDDALGYQRIVIDSMCPKILYESNPCRHSFIEHKFASGGLRVSPKQHCTYNKLVAFSAIPPSPTRRNRK